MEPTSLSVIPDLLDGYRGGYAWSGRRLLPGVRQGKVHPYPLQGPSEFHLARPMVRTTRMNHNYESHLGECIGYSILV